MIQKLSISNLSWNNNDTKDILYYLNNIGINNIELALSKISNWEEIDYKIIDFKTMLDSFNIKAKSFQSLFFNYNCNSLCEIEKVTCHLEKIIKYAKLLNTNILVLGSPKIRNKNCDISYLFNLIDKILRPHDMTLCIEPNAKIYDGQYFFVIEEIVSFLKLNKFTNIRTMIDTHNIILENQDPINIFDSFQEYIYHIHISEKQLKPIVDIEFHENFSNHLKNRKYDSIITYELVECEDIKDQIELFKSIYE